MSAAILHFGEEIDDCFSRLRQTGYLVHCSQQALDFDQLRRRETVYDLVSSSDLESEDCWLAAAEARKYLLVPSIFFQAASAGAERQIARVEASEYDLTIPTSQRYESWISGLDELIARGRRLRRASHRIVANSRELRRETTTFMERTNVDIARAKSLREYSDVSKPILNMLADRILKCRLCGEDFVFTAGEQLMFQLRWAMHAPDQCRKCNPKATAR
ncbi:MAG: zinc-ribbon domain containing protein [Acidobacteria bacterium]|nr:zinc-ribbon domain containing protein [Acidobacteriota bacterium]